MTMQRLIEGYLRFRASQWPERRATFEALARHGQSPRALVIACSDSRVDPAMIFSAAPGELFVIRNVANLVPPYHPDAEPHATSAAIEFAVRTLQVADIVVMGHAMCGGIRALLDGAPQAAGDFLGPWMHIAEPAKRAALACEPAEQQQVCEQEAVKLSLANLMTFPWIGERTAAGRLRLQGALFDIRTGVLSILQPDGRFAAA
jgi:carbonic anhydrase